MSDTNKKDATFPKCGTCVHGCERKDGHGEIIYYCFLSNRKAAKCLLGEKSSYKERLFCKTSETEGE